jgi:hypothetical protein
MSLPHTRTVNERPSIEEVVDLTVQQKSDPKEKSTIIHLNVFSYPAPECDETTEVEAQVQEEKVEKQC